MNTKSFSQSGSLFGTHPRLLTSFFILLGLFALSSCSSPGSPGPGPGGPSNPWAQKTITTVVGTGFPGSSGDNGPALSATLNRPYGIYVDSLGFLYIADYGSSEIRVVNPAHNIFLAAGTGSQGYNADGILPSAAKLYQPTAIAVDGTGNIYIADDWNNRIRKVTSTIATYAGNGTGSFFGDGGLATSAEVFLPSGVCLDNSGNLYIADQGNHKIRLVTASTGSISTIAGTTSGYAGDGAAATAAKFTSPYAVVLDASGNLYISDPLVNVVRKIDTMGKISTYAGTGASGYTGDGGPATSATLNQPSGLAVDSSGDLFIADSSNDVIRMVNTSGVISTVVGNGTPGFSPDGTSATSANLILPAGVALDSSGALYVADTGNSVVRVVK